VSEQAKNKASHIGAPAVFALEQCCQQLQDAFGEYGCYVVGSAMERANWRDVDVRYILSDEEFARQFPNAGQYWEHDPKWLLLTVAISQWMAKITGLPIDFQFQPQTHANERHKGIRNAVGLRIHAEPAPAPQSGICENSQAHYAAPPSQEGKGSK